MKLLIYIFFISINYALSDFIDEEKKVVVKAYPKKVNPGHYQIKYGKYVKSINTKATQKLNGYTVFPSVHNDYLNVPDSPYFEAEKVPEQTPRVKKVLPDSEWHSLRIKRSVNKDEGTKKTGFVTSKPLNRKLKVKTNKKTPTKHAIRKISKQSNAKLKRTRQRKNVKVQKNVRKGKPNQLKYTPILKRLSQKAKKQASRSKVSNKSNVRKQQHGRDFWKAQAHPDARRLISGRDAMIEEYPYVVSIQKEGQHWCAGALLNQRMVITTANCLWKANRMSHMRVRAGSRHTDRGGQVARIQEVMKHPGWKIRRNPENDVALALLDRNIRFSDSVHGVDLPNRIMMPAFEDAWITSWGAERRDGVFETKGSTLQVYHARVMDRQKCNNITQRFGVTVTKDFICLAQTGKRAPCTRDTGAPAVSDGVLWGLASWGIRKLCGTERFPAMFSYLGSSANLDFIINATHYLMADERFYPFPDRAPVMRVATTTRKVETVDFD